MTDAHRPDQPDRDPALDAAWREYSVETPPPALDAAILAAAHREARSRPRPAGDDDDALAEAREPSRWWWGLAAAATIGAIAFGIVQMAPPLTPGESMVASDLPQESRARKAAAPAPSAEKPAAVAEPTSPPVAVAPAPATAEPTATARAKVAPAPPVPERKAAGPADVAARPAAGASANEQRESDRSRQQGEPPARAEDAKTAATPPAQREPSEAALARDRADAPRPFPSAPQPAAAPPVELKKLEGERRTEPAVSADTGERARSAPVPAAAPTAPAAPAAPGATRSLEAQPSAPGAAAPAGLPPAAEFVARIEGHLAAGRGEEAARELNRFRAAYPDADQRLPQALRAWAASVPRP